MKVRDLYYQDFGFFAYGAVEFLDAAGKPLGEQIFINSRDLMLAEPLLFERMTLNDKRLSFDWRYAEKTLAVPAAAASVRLKFGFPSRVVGEAWLDDPQAQLQRYPAACRESGGRRRPHSHDRDSPAHAATPPGR